MRVVVITGSSRGIGRQAALEFAKLGYSVVVNYNNSEKEAFEVVYEIKKMNSDSICVKANTSKYFEAEGLIEASIKEFGKIDVLVNNAGISLIKLFQDVSESEWKHLFEVNVGSVFNCCSAVAKHMISRKSGKIINISSIWGILGASMEAHYSSSKAAIIGFTKSLAKELGPSGICVNCVAPGIINTQMNDFDEKTMKDLAYETPLRRIGTTLDVARLACFLASDDANFITGQVINVSGGYEL